MALSTDQPMDATPGQFPWQISMTWKNPPAIINLHFCSGAIITEFWILLSAYCITNAPSNGTVYVRTGSYNINKDDQFVHNVPIKQMIVHEKYEGAKTLKTLACYDIGLIQLGKQLDFDKRVQPILMAKSKTWSYEIKLGDNVILSGWGSISYGALSDHPDIMRTVNATIISNNECENAIKKIWPQFRISEMQICTTPLDGSLGACIGDIGGPLIYHEKVDVIPVLVGISNWNSEPCNKNGLPPVYTKVEYFLGWVEQKLKENCSRPSG
ncbi:PREDICTED: glandular kallikrein-3, submandibular-like [Ceratosolen solmsi marchali]|uniref:Glandular kallikrein-3, submandibular-like n=1 Tax=Ceratosolen solmsi marchali TaxID=326594 RepID=A0AAJ6YG15_9HYME|nr:PREDICTED: glandular kallikrein-3, submandibular-like [Ceratosolen solmsi marchali]